MIELTNNTSVTIDIPECRICLSSDEHFISPCRCKGTQGYVHRTCLNEWRATKQGDAFTQCSECHTPYVLYNEEFDAKEERKRVWKFRFLVARDLIGALFIIQLVIFMIGGLISLCDSKKWMTQHLFKDDFLTLYICGIVGLLFILGIIGCSFLCCGSSNNTNNRRSNSGNNCHHYHHHHDNYNLICCWPSDDLCGKNSSSDCETVVGLFMLLIALFFVVFGFFIAIYQGFQFVYDRTNHHMHVLWKRQEVQRLIVVDLAQCVIPDDSVEYANFRSELLSKLQQVYIFFLFVSFLCFFFLYFLLLVFVGIGKRITTHPLITL